MELYEQQLQVYETVVKKKQSVFVTGMAGVGKSKITYDIYDALIAEGYEVISVSFTGKAALNMPGEGTTVSRNVGMKRGSADFLPVGYSDRAAYQGVVRPSISTIYRNVDIRWQSPKLAIFIDEAGQLSSENARLFLDLGMLKRKDVGLEDLPLFVLTADFGQLSQIKGSCILEPAVYKYKVSADVEDKIVLPSIIEEIKPVFIELTEIVRQTDPVYLRALRWVYHGIALHPAIKERFYFNSPLNIKRIMFNNEEVVEENKRYVENYLKQNPNKKKLVFKAIYDPQRMYSSFLKELVPVLPEMTIAEGMIFNVTENVPDAIDRKKLVVANGESVIVKRIINQRSIEVEKSNGDTVELNYVQHSLPVDSRRAKPTFLQLPGYVGHSITLYRVQGMTFNEPVEYGAWQWIKEKRRSLRNHEGSVYVMLSRNTSLEDLYFDTSFGVEEAISLLRHAISTNKNVEKYVKAEKPLYITDPLGEVVVIELEEVVDEDILDTKTEGTVSFLFRETRLDINKEQLYAARYLFNKSVISPVLYWQADNNESEFKVIKNYKSMDLFKSMDNLARTWIVERSAKYRSLTR